MHFSKYEEVQHYNPALKLYCDYLKILNHIIKNFCVFVYLCEYESLQYLADGLSGFPDVLLFTELLCQCITVSFPLPFSECQSLQCQTGCMFGFSYATC